MIEIWDLWFPGSGATGASFARSRVEREAVGSRLLVHAAPPALDVHVRSEDGAVVASGENLERHQAGPMSYLLRQGDRITLADGWPTQEDVGRLVILPGGEAGVLQFWWHADDRSQWRWRVEFSNHR
jgi:hypothetical protein